MKQEHRLVAEVYRFLAPFVDTEKDVYVSLDGQAADTGVTEGRFTDSTIPDLWFTLVGATAPTLIEAKIVDENGGMLLMQSQLAAWRTLGRGSHKPHFWIAANRPFKKFYFWRHDAFLPTLDRSKAKGVTLTLRPPTARVEFAGCSELALHVLREPR